MLSQLSYAPIYMVILLCGAQTRNRTKDTEIFSLLLYRLSYRGILQPLVRTVGYLATRRGLEPLTSAVTGRRSNQLNYRAKWWEQ